MIGVDSPLPTTEGSVEGISNLKSKPPLKKKLLLFLSKSDYPGNIAIASTLAWLSKSQHYLFDNYYDSYHQGIHFGGGDSRNIEIGALSGGTVLGDRHFEEFYFMLLNFDVCIVSSGETMFLCSAKNLDVPTVGPSEQISVLYKELFNYLGAPMPGKIVMIGSNFGKALSGLEAYVYPEIFYRQAIGVPDSIPEEQLADLYHEGSKIFCLYVDEKLISRLRKKGYEIEVVDHLKQNDDYVDVTKRIALRWESVAKGWMLGDPTLVSYWLPKACEEDLIAIYGVPQEKILSQLGHLISSKGKVVYGRQYSDKDFFELSKLNQCLQVIDPCRPPFQSVKHVHYSWHMNKGGEGFYEPEYSDQELRQFACEGRILVSLMFWSGMIREAANFYNLMDLFAIARLRCGLVLTAQSYEYMMHSPLELITVPLEQGGVYPLIEPVLGSCGVGVGIESYVSPDTLRDNLQDALSRILGKTQKETYVPRGWWATMDTNLEKLNLWKRLQPFRVLRYSPYFQIRFHEELIKSHEAVKSHDRDISRSMKQRFVARMRKFARRSGLSKYFRPYRPYEFYGAGPIKEAIVNSVKSVGLKYMFTKSDFNSQPQVKHIDEDFICMNYTAGQWDGWTPFETVNHISDLRTAEKRLLKRKKPGWIVSTIDSCLWTFGGEFWKMGTQLYEIAQFCANGGRSGELINVKPFTIARYARIIAENNG